MGLLKRLFLVTFLFFTPQCYGYSQLDPIISGLYYLKEVFLQAEAVEARKINVPKVVCACGGGIRSINLSEAIGGAIAYLLKGAVASEAEYKNLLGLLEHAFAMLKQGSGDEIAQATCELSFAVHYKCPTCQNYMWHIVQD